MRKVIRKLDNTITWSASTVRPPIDLPKDGLITEIRIRWNIVLAQTMVANNAIDAHRRLMQSIVVEGDGGHTYFGYDCQEASRILALLNNLDFQTSLCSYIAGTTEDFTFILHPGSNPRDPFDMSAVIPAQELSNLQLAVECRSNACFEFSAANVSDISSGEGFVTVFSVQDVPTQKGIMTPQSSAFTWYNSTTALTDLGKEVDIPVGAYLRRAAVLCQDEVAEVATVSTGPARTDGEITEAGILLPKIGARLIDMDIEDLKALTATFYGLPCVVPFQKDDLERAKACIPDGFFVIDFRMFANKVYGLNLEGMSPGDILIGLTCAAAAGGEDTLIFWDQLVPWK